MSNAEQGPLDDASAHAPAADATIALAGGAQGKGEAATSDGVSSTYERGQQVGRYVITGELGRGAMGVVFGAYDPELDRKVAIKVLLPSNASTQVAEQERSLLLREAQALAKLSHPNVLPVYDVGTIDGRVFIAMEHVDGSTLDDWLKSELRPWRAVVAKFRDAGRGLAAAHAGGLVHRDFKPHNVLVSGDGSVRVMDFGLVRRAEDGPDEDLVLPEQTEEVSIRTPIESIFAPGSVVGTPAYMAPEQHRGSVVEASADQYAFCAALYHGLYGVAPFGKGSLAEVLQFKETLKFRTLPPGAERRVPRWLRSVILRGLQPRPEQRWPSMVALLHALERDPTKTAVRVAAATVAVGFALGGGWAYGQVQEQKAAMCTGGPAIVDGVWNPTVAGEVHTAFASTGVHYARDTAQRVQRTIDAYANAWTMARRDACEATHVRAMQSLDALDLRMACLDGRLREMKAVLDVLRTADRETVDRATGVIETLMPVEHCSDLERLQTKLVPPPEHQQAEVARLRERLAVVVATEAAGKHAEALTSAQEILTAAQALAYGPLIAEAQLRLGSAQQLSRKYEAAVETLSEAGWTAESHMHDEVAARAQIRLISMLGAEMHKAEEGLEWSGHARAAIQRLGAKEEIEADYHAAVASSYAGSGDWEKSYENARRALELHIRARGPQNSWVGVAHSSLGIAAAELKREPQAIEHQQKALEIRESLLGRRHPQVGATLVDLALAMRGAGEISRGLPLLQRAIGIFEGAATSHHRDIGEARTQLAVSLTELGEFDAAERAYLLALPTLEKALGAKNPQVARVHLRRAVTRIEAGDLEGAQKILQQVAPRISVDHAGDAWVRAHLLSVEGQLALAHRDSAAAVGSFERGLDLVKEPAPEHGEIRTALMFQLGQALNVAGRTKEAVTMLEQVLERHRGDEIMSARVQAELAKATLAANDMARTRRHAEDAATGFSNAGEDFADERDALIEWMRSNLPA